MMLLNGILQYAYYRCQRVIVKKLLLRMAIVSLCFQNIEKCLYDHKTFIKLIQNMVLFLSAISRPLQYVIQKSNHLSITVDFFSHLAHYKSCIPLQFWKLVTICLELSSSISFFLMTCPYCFQYVKNVYYLAQQNACFY